MDNILYFKIEIFFLKNCEAKKKNKYLVKFSYSLKYDVMKYENKKL